MNAETRKRAEKALTACDDAMAKWREFKEKSARPSSLLAQAVAQGERRAVVLALAVAVRSVCFVARAVRWPSSAPALMSVGLYREAGEDWNGKVIERRPLTDDDISAKVHELDYWLWDLRNVALAEEDADDPADHVPATVYKKVLQWRDYGHLRRICREWGIRLGRKKRTVTVNAKDVVRAEREREQAGRRAGQDSVDFYLSRVLAKKAKQGKRRVTSE